MIINIPLHVDEKRIEEIVEKDYEGKIYKELMDEIKRVVSSNSVGYYRDKFSSGLNALVVQRIDEILKEHKDEIIEMAAKELAYKLSRSKKGKEILENLDGQKDNS